MDDPGYKLEKRDHGWLVYINDDLDEAELLEVLDFVTLRATRKRSGSPGEDAATSRRTSGPLQRQFER